jgi:tetratricopeptide (TPR) repeat protein
MKMGRSDEAIESLGRALDMAPDDPLTLLRLGYVHKHREEWGLASSYLKKFLRQNPGDLDAGLLLAEVYLQSGREDLAGSMLRHVVRGLGPQELVPRLERLSRDASVARTAPDLDILLPHLAEAYQKEITVMKGNRDYCLGRAGAPAGKQNKENW